MTNPFALEGKTILITGASSGIGRAIAVECTKVGAKVVLTGRSHDRIKETYSMLEGTDHQQIVADLQKEKDLNDLVEQIPKLDGLVNCAGIIKTLPFQFAKKTVFDEVFGINFFAAAILSQSAIKINKIRNGSSIVFISSISGVVCSSIGSSIYSASKGAVNGLMKGMALDLAGKGIRVNCVNPGMIRTNIFSDGIISTEQIAEDEKRYPLKRHGKPEEVAYAVIYLLSDASVWMTGSNIILDGGYTLL